MLNRYAIVDKTTNRVVNIILWNGSDPYDVGSNFLLVKVPNNLAVDINWRWLAGVLQP